MIVAIWAHSGIGPALSWWFKTLKLDKDSSQQVTFLLAFLHIRLSVLEASSHFSFPGMEWIVSTKVRRLGEQLENSVLGGRTVFRTFVLIQFEWGQRSMELTACPIAPNSATSLHQTWPSQHHLLPWWLQWYANEALTTQKPEWSLSKVNQILSLDCSNPSQGSLWPSAQNPKSLLWQGLAWLSLCFSLQPYPKFPCPSRAPL